MLSNINRSLFNLKAGDKVLDIGSAEGANSLDLKNEGMVVTAIEIDPNLVDIFKAKPELKDVDVRVGDALDMPYPDNGFDGAILIEVIEHIQPTDQLLGEIYRVLKPGGLLCIAVPTGYTEKIYWRLHPDYAANATHVKIFSRKLLAEHLGKAGFSIKGIETKNFIPAVSWLFHSAARSKSDHTGRIHNHERIDKTLNPIFAAWSKTPLINKGLSLASRKVGKSWYIYAQKPS